MLLNFVFLSSILRSMSSICNTLLVVKETKILGNPFVHCEFAKNRFWLFPYLTHLRAIRPTPLSSIWWSSCSICFKLYLQFSLSISSSLISDWNPYTKHIAVIIICPLSPEKACYPIQFTLMGSMRADLYSSALHHSAL